MPGPSAATILRDHVSLSTACVDRLYLNGYVPILQTLGTCVPSCASTSGIPFRRQPRREVVVNIRQRKGEIRLEVRDSGPGVPRALVTRVFDSGFSTKAHGQPRGLGLALVKKVVVDNGGEVSVRNDGGAVFLVRLPALHRG